MKYARITYVFFARSLSLSLCIKFIKPHQLINVIWYWHASLLSHRSISALSPFVLSSSSSSSSEESSYPSFGPFLLHRQTTNTSKQLLMDGQKQHFCAICHTCALLFVLSLLFVPGQQYQVILSYLCIKKKKTWFHRDTIDKHRSDRSRQKTTPHHQTTTTTLQLSLYGYGWHREEGKKKKRKKQKNIEIDR